MSKKISLAEIEAWTTRYRVQFVNSLAGFKSVALIGTTNDEGEHNVAIFNSIFHIGSSPPLFGFVCRPANRERHTLENILSSGFYTINHIHEEIIEAAHQSSAKYKRNESEFDFSSLNHEFHDGFAAPFVKESRIKFSMEFQEDHSLMNKTTIIIGKVLDVYLDEDYVAQDGFIHAERANSITGAGCDAYYRTSLLKRMQYARPGKSPEILTDGD